MLGVQVFVTGLPSGCDSGHVVRLLVLLENAFKTLKLL
jgi:hypothetical protein